MKTPSQAAARYVNNGSTADAQNAWASDFLAAIPSMQARAKAQVSYWQSQVSTQEAAAAYVDGIDRMNVTQVTTKVNGAGKASFAAGVRASGGPGGKYTGFINEFMPAVSTEVQTLDRTNPRGTPAQNRARLNTYLDWLESQKGNFKQ